MIKLVLMRHGWSQWNEENRFTGWIDVDLHPTGLKEAVQGGDILKENGFEFDVVFTSVLQRAIKTTDLVLERCGQHWLPTFKAWQLNERHYGSLQGLNKTEMARQFGDQQVLIWRRSYDVRPPELNATLAEAQRADRRYASMSPGQMPATESLKDCLARVAPHYESQVMPLLRQGKRVFVSAHGNSLRALIKYLDHVPDEQIVRLTLPTAIPLVYELDDELRPMRHYYLGDPKLVEERIAQAEYRMYHVDGR